MNSQPLEIWSKGFWLWRTRLEVYWHQNSLNCWSLVVGDELSIFDKNNSYYKLTSNGFEKEASSDAEEK